MIGYEVEVPMYIDLIDYVDNLIELINIYYSLPKDHHIRFTLIETGK